MPGKALLLVISVMCLGCEGAIETAPQNTVVKRGENATLNCNFDVPVSQVAGREWIQSVSETLLFDSSGKANGVESRFSLGENFNLVITDVKKDDYGEYQCVEHSGNTKSAYLIYISPQLIVRVNSTADTITVMCKVLTAGKSSWEPKLRIGKGAVASSIVEVATFQYRVQISETFDISSLEDGDTVTCFMSYTDKKPETMTSNADTSIPASHSINIIMRKPHGLSVTKDPVSDTLALNDVVTCTASGTEGLTTTFQWLNSSNIEIGNGASLTITSNLAGQKVKCVATNVLGNATLSFPPDDSTSASTVTEPGDGVDAVKFSLYLGIITVLVQFFK